MFFFVCYFSAVYNDEVSLIFIFTCALHPALLSHLILFDSLDRER